MEDPDKREQILLEMLLPFIDAMMGPFPTCHVLVGEYIIKAQLNMCVCFPPLRLRCLDVAVHLLTHSS